MHRRQAEANDQICVISAHAESLDMYFRQLLLVIHKFYCKRFVGIKGLRERLDLCTLFFILAC